MNQDELLKYVEYIAIRYYAKHYKVFEKDAVSLDDLKQEAKLICLTMYKQYNKKHGVNNFDVKKFINQAVGWKLNDLLRGAIVNSTNMIRYEDYALKLNNGMSGEDAEGADIVAEDSVNRYHNNTGVEPHLDFYEALSSGTKMGFTIRDVLVHFRGKSLIILKKMIEGKSLTTIQKEMGYKNHFSVQTIITNEIRPKVEKLLKKQLSEIRNQSI